MNHERANFVAKEIRYFVWYIIRTFVTVSLINREQLSLYLQDTLKEVAALKDELSAVSKRKAELLAKLDAEKELSREQAAEIEKLKSDEAERAAVEEVVAKDKSQVEEKVRSHDMVT